MHSPVMFLLTCAAVCQLDGVCQVGGRVELLAAAAVAVIAQQLGVHIDGGHVIDDAPDAQVCRVLQQVPQHRCFAYGVMAPTCGISV